MKTPNCTTCEDTGHSSPDIFDLDCTDCDVAEQRFALIKFASDARRKSPDVGDLYWAIHQRALAMGMSASVEDTLSEMQPGGALHMPQEPVAHLKFWAAQSWSGNGNHDIDCGEGLEVCGPGEIGADGLPAFPVFLHAIPGSLAMAPKQEARKPTDISQRLREYAGNPGYSHNDYADTMRAAADEIERYYGGMLNWKKTAEAKDAAPAAANGAMTDKQIIAICEDSCGWLAGAKDEELVKFARAILAAAGPNAALVQALE